MATQKDLCEFEVILVYIDIARQSTLHSETRSSKRKERRKEGKEIQPNKHSQHLTHTDSLPITLPQLPLAFS